MARATVTLGDSPGNGGRNQEFVLAAALTHGSATTELTNITILSGGTDGEDGPTDAAGAVADSDTPEAAWAAGLDPDEFLRRHDAYPFFDRVGGLLRTGLTGTNVMDVRVVLSPLTGAGPRTCRRSPRDLALIVWSTVRTRREDSPTMARARKGGRKTLRDLQDRGGRSRGPGEGA